MKANTTTLGLIFLILSACKTGDKQGNGEDVSIVFKDDAGHSISKDDLKNITGQVNFEITTNQDIDVVAKALHDEARMLGQEGKYDSAIIKLKLAMQIQPNWAYPPYDLAYTYLLKKDFDSAYKYYQITDQLEPRGFFTVKTAVHTLEGERQKIYPKGLYAMYSSLEWEEDSAKKSSMAKSFLELAPNFAPAWKEVALLSNNVEEKERVIDQGLSKDPDADTKGILLINKAIVLNEKGKKDEAKQILGKLIFSQDATIGNVELAKFTLKSITE